MTFKEDDIRPHRLDQLRFDAQKVDIAWLLERKGDFHESDCPACSSDDNAPRFEKKGFSWNACKACGTTFMTPRPSAATLGKFYARSELYKVWNEHIFPSSERVRRERIFRPRVARMVALLERHGIESPALFEVGAAHGIFCDEAKKTGRFSRVVAVEPSSVQAETCRKLGIETIEAVIEDVTGHSGAADVVAAFEVIEHLADPLAFVTAMSKLLRPGGLLLVSTPNVQGFEMVTLGDKSDSVYPEHVTLFSPDGLSRMIDRAGLDTVEFETPGVLDCDIVRTKALAGVIDLSGQPFLKKNLIDEWDKRGQALQNFIAATGQSSHMWFVAQRRG